MSKPLEDYALIGDGETAALLNRDGSIDWLCWPRFDDAACFAALLGTEENGHWSMSAIEKVVQRSRRYQHDTLIMETELKTNAGCVQIIDFMPRRKSFSSVVRIVVGLKGSVRMRSLLRMRFNYGDLVPWTESSENSMIAKAGPDLVILHSPVSLEINTKQTVAEFDVCEGERRTFVLSYGVPHEVKPSPIDGEAALIETQNFWRDWIERFDDSRTQWPLVVRRSLITLKAMIHEPSGGIVASPTTSLPETPGGKMNWDYRYCWLRDSSFTLCALLNAGFHTEAESWRDWLLRAIADSPEKLRIMYGVDGSLQHASERIINSLPGYGYASPVRVGNAASSQHQGDVFGEVLDALSVARKGGLQMSEHEAIAELKIVEHLAKVWNTPSSGVWEARDAPRHYTYSSVMAWVGIDRFLRGSGGRRFMDSSRIEYLTALRQTIHDEICREGWNEGLNTFTHYYGGQEIDASLLLLPLVGFLPADDPRMTATIEKVFYELSEGGLIRRSKAKEEGPNEGTFLLCSCWMADCLNMLGRTKEAREQFERVLNVTSDLGLLSEEYNVPAQHLAGNFPQALTHLAIVNTALGLCGPVLQRGGG